ncbi:MAG: NAD-dependent succinate-semialdehyde dehydrogenase [Thermoanaerobaculia bacterium]
MSFEVINPATGETVASYPATAPEEVELALAAAVAAQREWRAAGFEVRAAALRRAAALLREGREEHAHGMTQEMGKPLVEARSEVDKCAWACEHYAEHGEQYLAPQAVETEAAGSYVAFEPLGLVLAIMPWNFPYWQVFRFAAPALMAGNGALLKHAPNVPGCALAIEELLQTAGLPAGLFRTLLIDEDATAGLIADSRVAAVTLTGSVRAGKAVAAKAGAALKSTVLELGGSDAYVVLEDADLTQALDTCVKSRLINNGQSCIAAKRFIVVEPLCEAFEQGVVERMRAARRGDPVDESNQLGPLARADLRDNLHRQVEASVAAGARLLLGGEVPEGNGFFYPPTVLAGVRPGMPAYSEELFGPVAAILPAADEAEAVRIANDTVFGLGAAVFTGDAAKGERIAREGLAAGCCFVNDFVRSDPRLPFGGVKESGYGRELGVFGIREFVNVKTVWVAAS